MNSIFFNDITPEEIESVTMQLKNESSYGFHELSTILAKKLSLISKPLSEKMKIAKVLPFF